MAVNPIRTGEESRPSPRMVLAAPPRAVTLLEDRAQVAREGKVSLPAGAQRITIPDVSPVVADRSLVVRATGARVDEARVVRRWRIGAEEKPGEAGKIADELVKLSFEQAHEQSHISLLEEELARADQAASLLVESLGRELPFAKEFPASRPGELEAFFAEARRLEADLDARRKALRTLEEKLAALSFRAQAGARVDQILQADLQVDVTLPAAGEVAIRAEYLVPCALWRPMHRATLKDGSVRFECEGAVWQQTGEDWADVDLKFSTARSTQQAEPPVLSDDWLQVQKKQEKKIQIAVREQVISDTGEGVSSDGGELPGVDDGGETRLLGAARRATVPSDGRLQRVPIFSFDAKAEVDRIARPERSRLVHLRSKQANASKQPILAGPVELLRESGYVGKGQVEFVAPGELFTTGWGGEEALRVHRDVTEARDTTRLTGKQIVTRKVELHLSNLDDRAASFRIEERVPVSEIEAVQIAIDEKETDPLARADDQGIVAWTVSIDPHGTKKVTLVYRITASSDVKGL